MKKSDAELEKSTTPEKLLEGDLETLRRTLRKAVAAYEMRLAGEIGHIRQAVFAASGKKLSSGHAGDLREMTGLIRRLDIKPDKGRRRDLKRIETLVAELEGVIEQW